jgi:ribose/xylose/arabinose/galactoside ABC-type transport system permease subunit
MTDFLAAFGWMVLSWMIRQVEGGWIEIAAVSQDGALVLTILRNGFTLQGISAYTFNIILGVAILVAMILNVYVARLRGAGRA